MWDRSSNLVVLGLGVSRVGMPYILISLGFHGEESKIPAEAKANTGY